MGTGSLWRSLRLGIRDPVKQLEVWTQRSASEERLRGILHLSIPPLPGPEGAKSIVDRWCQSPRFKTEPQTPLSLEIEEASWMVMLDISRSEFVPPGLRSLVQTGSPLRVAKIHAAPLYQQLDHLEMNSRVMIDGHTPPLPSLLSLRLPQLIVNLTIPEFMDYISGIPALQELELGCTKVVMRSENMNAGSSFIFDSLQRLTLSGGILWPNVLRAMDTPALTHLDLSSSSTDVCGLLLRMWARDAGVPPPIVYLCLSRCGVGLKSTSLRAIVLQLPLLEKLVVTDCGDDVNYTVLELAGKGGVQPQASSHANVVLPCPRLQYVDFSRCSQLKGTAIRNLVKSRLAILLAHDQSEAGSDDNLGSATSAHLQALPIQTLLIDQCPKVPVDLLPWLRRQVPRVSCVYETRAQVKERMPRLR